MACSDQMRPRQPRQLKEAARTGLQDCECGVDREGKIERKPALLTPWVLYSFRHTFLTRLGESGCDAWTLARFAGHSSITISSRYVHPSENAMSRLGGHKIGHSQKSGKNSEGANGRNRLKGMKNSGAPGEIRTPDLLLRRQSLYPAELRAHPSRVYIHQRSHISAKPAHRRHGTGLGASRPARINTIFAPPLF